MWLARSKAGTSRIPVKDAKVAFHHNLASGRHRAVEAAHQKGPDTPYCQATLEDCSRVAAQVQWLTMSTAIRPVLMVRPAQLNCSDDVRVPPNLRRAGAGRGSVARIPVIHDAQSADC